MVTAWVRTQAELMEKQTGYEIIICFFSVTDQSVQYTACQKRRGTRVHYAYIIIIYILCVTDINHETKSST